MKNLVFAMAVACLGGGYAADFPVVEDFTHCRDAVPGVVQGEGVSVGNDPIYSRSATLTVKAERDVDIFLEPKALPADNRFDLKCKFRLATTNAVLEAVLRDAGGKELAVPLRGLREDRIVILKAEGGQLSVWTAETNLFVRIAEVPLKTVCKTVNFRVKAGGTVSVTRLEIARPAPLPDLSSFAMYPSRSALESDLTRPVRAGEKVTELVSDGSALDLLGKCYTFVPGATGVVGTVVVTWDSGFVQKHPIAVGDELYNSPVPSIGLKQLGLKPKEFWHGPDAVVSFGERGSLARLFVRPSLKGFASYTRVCDAGMGLVREWNSLPAASRHLTTVEVRADANGDWLWIDGSAAARFVPPRSVKDAKRIAKAELVLNEGVAYRVNGSVRAEADGSLALQLWARPKSRAFADATFAKAPAADCAEPWCSADVSLARFLPCGFSYECDAYTSRTPLDGYPGEVHFRVPAAAYAAAEILFCLDEVPDKVPYLTTRLAHFSGWGSGCTEMADTVLDLRKGIPEGIREVGRIRRGGTEKPVYRATVELPIGRVLDLAAGDFIDIEFLGPTYEDLQQVDMTIRPRADVFSSFNLLDVRLRRLNVRPELVQATPGNVFTADEKAKTTSVKLTALVDGAKGVVRFGDETRTYSLAKAGDVVTNSFDFSDAEVGLYSVPVVFDDGTVQVRHDLVYCVTPEAGRDATAAESPYGTWWFTSHGSPGAPEVGGPLVQKAGIRKISANGHLKAPDYQRYDCTTAGFVYAPKMSQFDESTGAFKDGEEKIVAELKKQIAKKPFVDHIMVWHESEPSSGGIPPEVFGLAAPTNDTVREKKFAAYVNEVGRICHKHFPELKIQLGNTGASLGALAVPVRGGAKLEYYDQLGMEIPAQTIPPERPIEVGTLGMNVAKVAARKIAGREIPTAGCYEFIYRTVRDLGVRGADVQAAFYTRDLIITQMNGYRLSAPGLLFDCRNAYCSSLWGCSGIVGRSPYVYPKKSYLAYAVVTKVLDGVRFVREIPTGSTTVYAAEFVRKDGRYATAFWCARGEADLVCDVKGELWTMYGRRSDVGGWFSDAKFTCSGEPVYVISKKPCASVAIAARRFPDDAALAAQGRPAADISLANATVSPDPEMESTHHAFLPYLKPGAFTAKDVVDPEEGACLELTLDTAAKTPFPAAELVTEYTTVRLREPVAVPGEVGLVGLRVKGGSSWAQVRFEIEDAEGEVFKGLSSGKSWGCDIYDWPGYTALSFDGWNDVYQYTVDNGYGLIISPGPRNEQWVSSTVGNRRIDWPIRIRAVTVAANRYKPTLLGFEKVENPSIRLKRIWTAPRK